ncbi:MAG: 3-hydroxyacyl-CoA dehydrogenase family protein [Deltaproteobacteria bacterium]|nr:3-hydroxyacyl-CoA dehydrogenase family protein [Deltaproteobacteria bacterium]
MLKELRCVGVVGAGTMGRGIAQVFAMKNCPVVLFDSSKDALANALPKIKEHTSAELWPVVAENLKTSADISALSGCGLIIEAVFEEARIKKDVLKAIESVCRKDALIATNTSSISIDELADALRDPSRFAGMHFMNPPKVMKLVEVVKGKQTSDETVRAVVQTASELDKVTAVVKDTPGFVTNRLLFALLGEAMRLLQDGVASREDIDATMKHGMNHPMGPLELADFIGLDVCLDIMIYIAEKLEDEKYAPPAVLVSLVTKGRLGKKTRHGFYNYDE